MSGYLRIPQLGLEGLSSMGSKTNAKFSGREQLEATDTFHSRDAPVTSELLVLIDPRVASYTAGEI